MSTNPNDILSITRDEPSESASDPLDFLSLTRGPQRGQPSPYDIAQFVSPNFQQPSPIERGDGGFSLTSPITEFGKGLWQSLSRTNFEMLGETIEAASEALVHGEGQKQAIRDMGKRLQDWARRGEQPEPPVSWEEAEGVMGTLTYLGGLAGSGIGSTIPPLVGGAVGFAVGGPAGAAVGAFSIGSALNTGEAYAQFKREGIADSAQWAVGIGQVISAIDTIGLGKVVDAAGMRKIKSMAIGDLVKRVSAVGKGMTAEGLTEMAQSTIRESTAAVLTDNPNVRERAFSILEEGLAGALTGGIFSATGQGAQALGRTSRKTTAEAAGDEGAAAARARATGDPLDPYVEAGERVVAEINADADVGTSLQELGFSAPGGEMVYRAPDGTEERVIVRGLVPAEDIDGVQAPESILLETLAGDQFDEALPLRESVSLTPVPTPEGVAADADFTRFSEEIGAIAEGLPEGVMEAELAREGAVALENIPQERRQPFLKALKTKAKESSNVAQEEIGAIEDQEAKETADRDAGLIFDQQVEDLRGEYGDVDQISFGAVDASIRQKMGIAVGESVPATRHKAYLALAKAGLRKRSAETQAKPVASKQEEGTVRTEAGRELPFEYRVVEGKEIVSSNIPLEKGGVGQADPRYDQAVQNRGSLENPNEREKIRTYKDELDYGQVGRSTIPGVGAPIANKAGTVAVGNSRYHAIMWAYAEGKADDYRQKLEADGFDTTGLEKPVLVRALAEDLTPGEMVQLGREGNVPLTGRLGTTDQAMSDATQIDGEVLDSYHGGGLTDVGNREFLRRFIQAVIPKTERKDFTTDQGDPDISGITRMESALMAFAYDSRQIVSDLKATTDPVRKSLRNVMTEMAPAWAKAKSRILEVDSHAGHHPEPCGRRNADSQIHLQGCVDEGDIPAAESSCWLRCAD